VRGGRWDYLQDEFVKCGVGKWERGKSPDYGGPKFIRFEVSSGKRGGVDHHGMRMPHYHSQTGPPKRKNLGRLAPKILDNQGVNYYFRLLSTGRNGGEKK